MKCPKCGYLGFESGDRCRNCGYDFSLAAERPQPRTAGRTPSDLPLFRGDVPLPPPRPPLAVRKASPTPARIRPRVTPVTPAPQTILLPSPGAEDEPPASHGGAPAAEASAHVTRESPAAPAGRRAAAAGIDLCLLALVDLVVVHFTLALCGLTFADLGVLPLAPLAAFLALLNAGYVVLFTGTLGQTFGKMAAAIEVVADGREKMDLRRSALRAAAIVVAVLPAGVGWFAALVGDRRGLHDRLAGTRVISVAGI